MNQDTKPIRILVTEDDVVAGMLMTYLLKDAGYDVLEVAQTGEHAIELAESYKPDLIIMDVRLAGEMDGIEATERIKSKLSIPVIFCTAFNEPSTIKRAESAGANGFIMKPVNQDEALQIIAKILSH
jgi:two-component system, response regulator PdtaR